MRLTKFTDYSLRVLMYVAARPESRATISGIARAHGISEHHLTKVVHFLGRAGYLENTRGRGGGIRLARPAAQINIGTVVQLAEGPDVPAECFEGAASRCPITPACRLIGVLGEAVAAFYASLGRYTLADVTANREALARILFMSPAAPAAPATAQARSRRRKSARARAKPPAP